MISQLFNMIIPMAMLPVLLAILFRHHSTFLRFSHSLCIGLSGLGAMVVGLFVLATNATLTLQFPVGVPGFHCVLWLDALSGFFLFVTGLIGSAVSIYSYSYFRRDDHAVESFPALSIFTSLFVSGMYLVLLANDLLAFLFAWEMMSLSSYFLVAHQHQYPENRQAAMLYLIMAHLSGLLILLGLSLLAHFNHSWCFQSFNFANYPKGISSLIFLLLFFGFGTKAGLVPLHVWLPKAHPAAPSPISALMSGGMIKIAVYGFVRFCFTMSSWFHWQWGVLVLTVGSVSALLGVLYALMQHDLKCLLAYHSVENIGIIFIGLGLSMIFFSLGFPVIAAIGLIAALYHVLNHAIFKSLLFLGAGTITQLTHEKDLEMMGGLIRNMPVVALFFLIGCLSIAALPPFNGFVSEWLTFQTALQATVLKSGILRVLIPLAAASLALTSALASACFVKVFGIIFLGNPRSKHARQIHRPSLAEHLALGFLALLCVVFGVLPVVLIRLLNSIAVLFFHQGLPTESMHHWLWLYPLASTHASYQPLVILFLIVGILGAVYLVLRRYCPFGQPKRVDVWDCGFGGLTSRMQYTAAAFAMPIRRVFQSLWIITEKRTVDAKELGETSDKVRDEVRYELTVEDRIWRWIYEPIARRVLAVAKQLARIQGGNIRAYLAYTFIVLLILLWVVSCNLS